MTLQVIPFARGGHAGASGAFSILRFEERDLPDVVYIEQLTSALYLDQRPDRHDRKAEMTSDEPAAPDGGTAGKAKPPTFDTSVANQARIYDYLLGGCFL